MSPIKDVMGDLYTHHPVVRACLNVILDILNVRGAVICGCPVFLPTVGCL